MLSCLGGELWSAELKGRDGTRSMQSLGEDDLGLKVLRLRGDECFEEFGVLAVCSERFGLA